MNNQGEPQKSVLVIEDENSLLSAVSIKLTKAGYVIFQARNGEEGLDAALKNHPDLIILDILMPKLNGLNMLHKLRGDGWGKTAKVIIFTNLDANGQIIDDIVADQPSYYLVKNSTSLEMMLEKVKEVLQDDAKTE